MIRRCLAAGALLLLTMLMSCAAGDQERPGRIDDLVLFTDPDALSYPGSFQLGTELFPAKTYTLAFTSTGDNKDDGAAAEYDLRYISSAEVLEKGLNPFDLCHDHNPALHRMLEEPLPQKAGRPEIFSLVNRGFARAQAYHFCLWVIDEIGQRGNPASTAGTIPFLGITLKAETTVPGLGDAAKELGDFNSDGFPDVSLASPLAGKVLIYFGRPDSELFFNGYFLGRGFTRVGDLDPSLTISGSATPGFGQGIENVGDVDNDAKPELAISAPSSSAGTVFLFKPPAAATIDSSSAWAVIDGEAPGDTLGSQIASCGDLNADSIPDFAIGAPGAEKVYIVFGGTATSTLGPIPASGNIAGVASVVIKGIAGSGFGASLACGSNINGDATPDLLVGAQNARNGSALQTGAAYLFLGGKGVLAGITARSLAVSIDLNTTGQADATIFGQSDGAKFGASVAFIGDVIQRASDDVSRDFAVGAPGMTTGAVYVFYGGPQGRLVLDDTFVPPFTGNDSTADLTILGESGEIIGAKVRGKADLNRDGHHDLATSNGFGAVKVYYLVPGAPAASLTTQLFSPESPATDFELAPDFDKDGLADVLIGAGGLDVGYLLK